MQKTAEAYIYGKEKQDTDQKQQAHITLQETPEIRFALVPIGHSIERLTCGSKKGDL